MKIQGSAILVLPNEAPEKTKSGIIITGSVKEKPNTGTVIDFGEGCQQVQKGDSVWYNRKTASVITIEGIEYHFINEKQVFYFAR